MTKKEIFTVLNSLHSTLQELGVQRIGLFGSCARNENTDTSDVDFVVTFQPGCKNFTNFYNLAETLEQFLDRPVEIITEESVNPYIKQEIEKDIGYYEVSA